MKVDKAIEILTLHKTCDFEGETKDLDDALQLGVEALKQIKLQRQFISGPHRPLLPGETNE